METDYDFAVIGGGSAGYAAARTAISLGLKTVVLDGAKTLGGLCILRGCMPSKALIEIATRASVIREADHFGLGTHNLQPDLPAIQAWKRRIINNFAEFRQTQLTDGKFDLIRGTAAFLDPHRLTVKLLDGQTCQISAATFCISTGSSISLPSIPGLAESQFWTSNDILETETLPKRLTVLGGGAIGLEMAYFAAQLGTVVTVIQRNSQILSDFDPDVSTAVRKGLSRMMTLHTNTKLIRVDTAEDKTIVFQQADGTESQVTADQILVALGRQAATAGLNLAHINVTTDGPRILTNDAKQTSLPHIFAAGDCTDSHQIVHTAVSHGEVVARNVARLLSDTSQNPAQPPKLETIDRRLQFTGVFCEPQSASLGLTETAARATGIDYATASHPFSEHGKSIIHNTQEGFVKLLVDKTSREIIGASAVGPQATELIHEIVVAMHFRATAGQLASIPHYHPTLSEIWTYPAEELM